MQGVSSPWHPTLPGGCDHLAAVQCKHACIYKAELIPFLCKFETEGICSPHQLPFWQGGSDPTSSHIRYIISIFACDLLTDPASVPRTTYYVSRILCLVSRTSYFVPSTSHPAPCTWHITSHFLFISYSLSASFIWFCSSIGHPPSTHTVIWTQYSYKVFCTSYLVPRTTYFVLRTTYHVPRTSYLIPCTTYHVHMLGMPKRAQASNL